MYATSEARDKSHLMQVRAEPGLESMRYTAPLVPGSAFIQAECSTHR